MSKREQIVGMLSASLKIAREVGDDNLAYLLDIALREAVTVLMEEWDDEPLPA